MKKANLPIESACEPDEEARQPSSAVQNDKQMNMKCNSEGISDSGHSTYKNHLSQTPSDLTQREKLQWLQKKRTKGLWVQCDECDRWRYIPDVLDSHELPKKWYCHMHPDISLNKCSIPEIPIPMTDLEDLVYGEYAAGSIVVGRLTGWPWWPAMVDDCPDTEQYYWFDGFSDIPTHYNVVFFDAFEVTRAWLTPSQMKPYTQNKSLVKSALKNKSYRKRLEVAITQANDAEKLSLEARLKKYSFVTRYKGTIASPQKLSRTYYRKYQEQFKRKFNVDLPEDFSDFDDEISQSQKSDKTKKLITLGRNKKNKGNDL